MMDSKSTSASDKPFSAEPANRRNAGRRRWLWRVPIALVVIVVTVPMIGFGLLQTGWGQRAAVDLANGALADSGLVLTIDRIDGLVPFAMTIVNLRLDDALGPAIEAENLRLVIAAGPLLTGEVTVRELAATRIAIWRAPGTPPAPDTPPTALAWPSLPVDLALDRLAIERLEVGAALAGEDMALTIDGSFVLDARSGTATLTVNRIGGRPARIAMSAVVADQGGTIAFDLIAEEPEGGVAPRLVGWAYDGPWRLALNGDGPVDEWLGRLTLTAGEEMLMDVALTGVLDPDAPHLTLKGGVSLPAEMLPAGLASSSANLDLSGGLAAERATIGGTIEIRGVALMLAATASLAAPITIDATVEAVLEDIASALAGLDLPVTGGATIRVTAQGPLDAISGDIALSGTAVDAFGWRADAMLLAADFAGSLLDQTGNLSFALTLDKPTSMDVDLAAYGVDALRLSAKAAIDLATGVATLSDIALAAGPTRLDGAASLALAGGPIGFDAAVSTNAGVALAGAGISAATGRLVAQVSGAFDPDAGLGWIETAARGDGLVLNDPLLDVLLGATPTVTASGQIDAARGLQGLDASVSLPAITANLTGDLAFDPIMDGAAPLGFSIEIPSLTPLAEPFGLTADGLAGAVVASGSIGAPLSDRPRGTVDITAEGLRVEAEDLGTVAMTLAVVPDESDALLADLVVSIDGVYGPMTGMVEATIDPAGNSATLDDIDIVALGARLTGRLGVDLSSLMADGDLDLAVANLATLAMLTGTPLAGRAIARIALTTGDSGQGASISLTGGGLIVAEAVTVDQVQSTVTIANLLGDLTVRATAEAQGIAGEGFTFEQMTLGAAGSLGALDLTLAATGQTAAADTRLPLALNADARLGLGDGATDLRIASLEAMIGEERLVLNQPAGLRLAGAAVALTEFDASLLGGRIVGALQLSPTDLNANFTATDIALGRAAALTGGVGVAATLDRLAIDLSGSGARPNGTIALALSGVEIEGEGDGLSSLSDAQLVVDARILQGMLDIDATIGNVTAEAITFFLNNAVRLSLAPFAADFSHGQPLDGRLLAQSDLADLGSLVAPSGDILLGGLADLDIRISGVGGAPVFLGDGVISDGSVEVTEIGLSLVDLHTEISGEGDRLTLRRFVAADRQGGTLGAEGWADFGAGDAAIAVDLSLNQLAVLGTDYADAQVSGPLSLSGPLTAPSISGDLTVRPAEIRFAAIRTGGFVEIDVVDVNGGPRVRPEPVDPVPPIALPLDLTVTIPNALFVRGYGLDSEWGGALQVRGTTARPIVTGGLNVIRGTLDLAGQPIEIDRGLLTFTGASPPDPLVDVEAVAVTDDIAVIITVSGPASATQFDLQSVPALPQEEMLSRLLFGTGQGRLSGNQAFQAGRALALLTGGEGDLGIVNTLRSVTGITGLTIEADSDAEGNPAGRIGGYITEDVYVSAARGSATGSGQAEISVEVFDGIAVESGVTETGDSEIGLTFEWDY